MTWFICVFIVVSLLVWGFWQIGWKGGRPENGRDVLGAGGDTTPFW